MGFKDLVAANNKDVFLNSSKFAEIRTVKYDGITYKDIPIILTEQRQSSRQAMVIRARQQDNAQGLYTVTNVLQCSITDLGGVLPEKGQRIKINYETGGGGYFSEYYVASSSVAMGMLRIGLEAIDD